MQLIKNQSKIVTEELPPLCRYTDDCSNNLCQFRHDTRSKSKSQTSEDQDILKHVMTSTPIKVDILKNECKVCALDIPPGHCAIKCEECEKDVCETCAKESHDSDNLDHH